MMRERYAGKILVLSSASSMEKSPAPAGATCEALVRLGEWTAYYEICGRKARSRLTGQVYERFGSQSKETRSVDACGTHDHPKYGLDVPEPTA
jgi:hypothetical protein